MTKDLLRRLLCLDDPRTLGERQHGHARVGMRCSSLDSRPHMHLFTDTVFIIIFKQVVFSLGRVETSRTSFSVPSAPLHVLGMGHTRLRCYLF